jgi:shikimate kinase
MAVVALVGLPGSGKSTVGRQLARRFRWSFVDSDAQIEQRLGCSIRSFFEMEGEQRFRDIEADEIDRITQGDGALVLSTGGGSVLRIETRQRLQQRCRVVYLRSSPEELYRRLKNDKNRPLLQVADPLAKLRDLFEERDPLYQSVAHYTIDTGRPSVATLVNMISMQLELAGCGAEAPGDPSSPGARR